MKILTVSTHEKRQVIDITDMIEKVLIETSGSSEGVCHLAALHTTVALSIANLDRGTDLDMLDAFYDIVPKLEYRHQHNPGHVADHILSTLIGPAISVTFSGGRLVLGNWQRVVLFEFDGPREREVAMIALEAT